MTKAQRWAVLLGALATTIGLVIFVSHDSEYDLYMPTVVAEASRAEERKPPGSSNKSINHAVSAAILDMRTSKFKNDSAFDSDPFAVRYWYVAPPSPKSVPLPPSRPNAPPLPFRYLGMLKNADGSWLVQLARGSEEIVVTEGETFGDTYRLDSLQDGNLLFTYLPLGTQQTLPTILDSDL